MRKALLLHDTLWVTTLEFEEGLDFYYEHIDCDLIDIVHPFTLSKLSPECRDFIFIVDDEALLKANPRLNAIATYANGSPIYGNVIVAKEAYRNEDLVTVGLTKEDIELFNETMLRIVDGIK